MTWACEDTAPEPRGAAVSVWSLQWRNRTHRVQGGGLALAGHLVLWREFLLGHGHHWLAANRSMEGLDHTCTSSPLRGCWEGGCRNLCFHFPGCAHPGVQSQGRVLSGAARGLGGRGRCPRRGPHALSRSSDRAACLSWP